MNRIASRDKTAYLVETKYVNTFIRTSLSPAFLSASWLKAKIKENSVNTPYVKADDALLLTGTTEELQELVFCYANDDQAFADPLLLEKQRLEEEQ